MRAKLPLARAPGTRFRSRHTLVFTRCCFGIFIAKSSRNASPACLSRAQLRDRPALAPRRLAVLQVEKAYGALEDRSVALHD